MIIQSIACLRQERDKVKKAISQLRTISELGRGESVKPLKQRLMEHEASFGFCFYGGYSW